MARSKLDVVRVKNEVFRVIDDGDRVITTQDPYVALKHIAALIEKYNINHCWVDFEVIE